MSEISRREFVKGAALAPLALSSLPAETSRPVAALGDRYDIVIAGAGHNSLIATAYLAKAGYRCLVLEGYSMIGGGVISEELTLPGYKHDTCSTAHNGIQGNPVIRNDELKLHDYGLEYISPDPIMHMPFADGTYITQWADLERTAAEFAKFSKKDGEAYERMYHESEAARDLLGGDQYAPPGTGKPLNERLAANPMGKFWQRRLAMSQWEVIKENFECDHCRSFLMATPWSMQPPQYPMTGRSAYSAIRTTPRKIAKGGSGALTQALAKYIEAHNGVILTKKMVARLIIENGKCVGVECADGSSYRADKAVLSTMHIKHLVDMAPRDLWPAEFLYGADTWEGEISEVVTHYAISEPPKYPIKGGTISPVESAILANPERLLRFAYENECGISSIDEPPISIFCSSIADPSRAPAGKHTLKILGFHPYNIKEGPQHWDTLKNKVSDAQLNYLRRFAPNLTDDKILGRFVMSPLDLERKNPSFWHGSIHGGSSDPSQSGAMRPMAGWAQYRMPIPGLYQTGATTYPGGSVTGAPGRNAAVVMLKDFGTSIEEVVAKGS
jgi:phytoene dehydrogenase-like protein